jgi:hypothetical protein
MSAIDRTASRLGRRDEVPNQQLARQLAASGDRAGIQEIAAGLWQKNPQVQRDCVKVLYEVGYLDPSLVAAYADDFVRLLKSRHNRLVWGGMIALSTVADLRADELFPHADEIRKAMHSGSVIAMDNGVAVLARIASRKAEYNRALFPFLLDHLSTCRPKEVPQHAEKTLPAVNAENKTRFLRVLEKRMEDLLPSQIARLKKTIRAAAAR